MNIGERLKSERTVRRWSQKELAALSGVSQQMISYIENGKVKSTGDIVPLAQAMGLTAEWLFSGTGPKSRAELVFDEIKNLPPADQAKIASDIHARLAGSD